MAGGSDFFTWQDRARRRTSVLVFYFGAAVAAIIAAIYIAVAAVLANTSSEIAFVHGYWNTELFLGVAACVSLIVLAGTFYKVSALAGPGGGVRVATMLGGRLVNTDTRDPDERKLLNVVEEMAIASGAPVPPVFVLDEDGINAFAAGYTPGDAVVAVTQGAMRTLSRDELQGVVAHEFSHVFNGDMRLNIRLIAVLHGIILLALIGSLALRIVGRGSGRRRSGKGGGAIILAIILVAIVLIVVGYIGEFFARLIQMAVSRQREFLADASAVQFTRNPGGLGGALKKIAVAAAGSRLDNANAKAASHLFFADGVKRAFSGMLSTHPDINDRIRRLDPSWDREHAQAGALMKAALGPAADTVGASAGIAAAGAAAPAAAPERLSTALPGAARVELHPEQVVSRVGTMAPEQVDIAGALIGAIPETLSAAAHEPFGARAVVFALLLDRDPGVRKVQVERLRGHADQPVLQELARVLPAVVALPPAARLPLLELALPSLRQLSEAQWVAFVDNVDFLIQADSRVSVFEIALRVLVMREYRRAAGKLDTAVVHRSLAAVAPEVAGLLSVLAWSGSGRDPERARQAFQQGAARLATRTFAIEPLAFETLTTAPFERALDALAKATPMVKKWVVDASVACVAADKVVGIEEAELVRVVGSALDCPIPPFAAVAAQAS